MTPKFNMPYTIADEISYDPAARDLSVEVTKAKATNADAHASWSAASTTRTLMTRELAKQRWTPQGDPERGARLVRGSVLQDAGQAVGRPDELRALV